MQIDQTTLNDLTIFQHEEEYSVFHQLNFTQTNDGRHFLKQILASPLKNIGEIIDVQNAIKQLSEVKNDLPKKITNGTIMVMERFYETPITSYPYNPNRLNTFFYKIFYSNDFSLTKYSVQHLVLFIKEIKELIKLLQPTKSKLIQFWVDKLNNIVYKRQLNETLQNADDVSTKNIITIAAFFRHHFKQDCLELIEIYGKLDAYLSLAIACEKHHFVFPEFVESESPIIQSKGLFHLLLTTPTCYDIELKKQDNFLFLTGANMAGKSTFIKAIGIAVYLAHLGIGVPAMQMTLSCFDGLLSNIHIVDNIFKNESYFFNEVQRVKKTVEKIEDGKKWLILIDELFKGTNVQDAMKCSTIVIEGLQKKGNAVFVLSTHLYEIADALKKYHNIQFQYFETNVKNNELIFNYQLKKGISSDRIGYLILEREGVVDLLKK